MRAIAVQALREGAALERLAPVLVRNLRRGRWVVRQGALEALAALTPMALASHMHEVACSMYIPMSPLSLSYISPISHMHEVACCMADTHTAVRLSALETLEQLEPFDLAEIAPRASQLINEANPLIVASALDLLARLAPEDLAPYADQINCCRFDQAADVRAAAQRRGPWPSLVRKGYSVDSVYTRYMTNHLAGGPPAKLSRMSSMVRAAQASPDHGFCGFRAAMWLVTLLA